MLTVCFCEKLHFIWSSPFPVTFDEVQNLKKLGWSDFSIVIGEKSFEIRAMKFPHDVKVDIPNVSEKLCILIRRGRGHTYLFGVQIGYFNIPSDRVMFESGRVSSFVDNFDDQLGGCIKTIQLAGNLDHIDMSLFKRWKFDCLHQERNDSQTWSTKHDFEVRKMVLDEWHVYEDTKLPPIEKLKCSAICTEIPSLTKLSCYSINPRCLCNVVDLQLKTKNVSVDFIKKCYEEKVRVLRLKCSPDLSKLDCPGLIIYNEDQIIYGKDNSTLSDMVKT